MSTVKVVWGRLVMDSGKTLQQFFEEANPGIEQFAGLYRAKFKPEKWAPGLWAGTEGARLTHIGTTLEIVGVLFEDRMLELKVVS